MTPVATPFPAASVFSFGTPVDTDAFGSTPRSWRWTEGELPLGWSVTPDRDKGFVISVPLGIDDAIVGLGQHMGTVNCRGRSYRAFSTDAPMHTPEVKSMYGANSFMLILGERPLGIFVDCPGEVCIDAGAARRDTIQMTVANAGFYLAVIEAASAESVVSTFLKLVGLPFVPPRWAFGYQQSRWSYANEAAVRSIADNMEKHDIPCDVIHMDIHYMQDYKVFTINQERFLDVPGLARDLAQKGIRLVSIIDPGVKVEAGFSVYEEGKSKGFFCQRTDGDGEFVGAVWPGPSVFPDFFREDVRQWWGKLYVELKTQGFAGFWNDMNEPALFYTPKAFKEYAQKVHRFDTTDDFSEELSNLIWDKSLCNNEAYYDQFGHEMNGELVPNRVVHNLFGTLMTRATADALQSEDPSKRYFLLSRSSYPGMHRYAAIWTGDNHSWWEHLSLNIQMLISLNLSGFMFCGADIGGFGGQCTGEMLVRWTQLGAFAPFFRNHAALWARPQEPWAFDEETLTLTRAAIQMRYALLPYIYSEFVHAASLGTPFIRGLFLDFREANNRLDEDEFLCGPALLVAPIVQSSVRGRRVYLPGTCWLKVKASATGLCGERVIASGEHFIECERDEIPLFMKPGGLIAMTNPARHTTKECPAEYRLLGFTDTRAECAVLLDDGETKYSSWESYPKFVCTVEKRDDKWTCEVRFENAKPRRLSLCIELWNSSGGKDLLLKGSDSCELAG